MAKLNFGVASVWDGGGLTTKKNDENNDANADFEKDDKKFLINILNIHKQLLFFFNFLLLSLLIQNQLTLQSPLPS